MKSIATVQQLIQHKKSFTEKIINLSEKLTADGRHYQLAFLVVFLSFGIVLLQWEIKWINVSVTFLSCIGLQLLYSIRFGLPVSSVKSAAISAFSICLMFRANEPESFVLASVLSISSKFIFRINKKHFFNPTNFGIISALILLQDGWISPGQWGSTALNLFLIGAFGMLVLIRVNRLDTAIGFFLAFAGMHWFRSVVYQGWTMDFWTHQLGNGTLLLFTFFMITDPVSTPANKKARITWSIAVGIAAWYLQVKYWVNGAPLWALFFLSMPTPIIDHYMKANPFEWKSAQPIISNQSK